MNQPSLHPVVDPNICIGCGACVKACPEKALGMVQEKAVLVEPVHIVSVMVPVKLPVLSKAFILVFGTERRGMDIPQVQPYF